MSSPHSPGRRRRVEPDAALRRRRRAVPRAVPRVAIDAKGGALLAYETGDRGSVGRAAQGRRVLAPEDARQRTLDYAVAPGAVAYEAKDGIHVAMRTAAGFKPRKRREQHGLGDQRRHDRRRPARRLGRGRAPVPAPRQRQAVPRARALPRRRRGPGRDVRRTSASASSGSTRARRRRSPCSPTAAPCSTFQRERATYGDPRTGRRTPSARTAARSPRPVGRRRQAAPTRASRSPATAPS